MKKMYGFSLTELLISLCLSALILLMLTRAYLSTKLQFDSNQRQIANQVDVAWVIAVMADSVRRSGFSPCGLVSRLKTSTRPILGLAVQHEVNDILTTGRMSEFFVEIDQIDNAQRLVMSPLWAINSRHPVMITDCYHAELNYVSRVGGVWALKKPLAFDYHHPVYLGTWIEERWFIKKNSQKKLALYYGTGKVEELTAAVESLKIVELQNMLLIKLGVPLGAPKEFVVRVRNG